jgi:prepilin-type N-terminal cleavage/methylation domain-containing protein
MSTAWVNDRKVNLRLRAFTLLEITIAVSILGLMSLTIYRFVQANIVAVRVSSETSANDEQYTKLRELLNTQLQSLPAGAGALTGEPLKLGDRSRDSIRWICSAGPGLLTRYAPGEFIVVMRLQTERGNANRFDLGFVRKPRNDGALTNEHESWVRLIDNVDSLRIRYFDPRINVWLDKWTDTITLPRLVKVTIGRRDAAMPWEAVIPLARTPL